MTPPDNMLSIAQAFITWTNSQIGETSVTLTTHRMDLSMAPHPRYVGSPVTTTPELLLRPYQGKLRPRPNQGIEWHYKFSYWYYKLQTAGADNDTPLLSDLMQIESIFIGDFDPEPIKAAGCDFVMPVEIVVHNELDHISKNPALRLSVGEIVFDVITILN